MLPKSFINKRTKPSREPEGPQTIAYNFSYFLLPGAKEIKSASVTGAFTHKSFKTYELRIRSSAQGFTNNNVATDTVVFERPRPGAPFDGKVYYYFTINGRRVIDETKKIEQRWFVGQDGHRWNILEQEDLPSNNTPPPPPRAQKPPAPPPQLPAKTPPKVGDITTQKLVPASTTSRVRPRLNIQPKNGICLFYLRGSPEIKEAFVTGIYDAWGRKRTEKLIWNPKTYLWGISLRISIPLGQENVENLFIVKRTPGVGDETIPRSRGGLVEVKMRGQPISRVNISEPVFLPTRFIGMSHASSYFATVIRAKFPGTSGENSRFAIAGGDVHAWNSIAGDMKWNPINSMWEIRIVFDWIKRSQDDKVHYQIREFVSESIGWKNVINKDLPYEDVDLVLDTDVQQWRRGPPPKVTRNYVPISYAYETKWPFVESIFALGKYTFFWSAPTSPTTINRVLVEGPFTQDPSVTVSRDLKRLLDGTWSLTLEIPARKMRYRYLVDGMYQTNWHENREMDENNLRWNYLQDRDLVFEAEDEDEDDADITISRSTLKGLLEGSLPLDSLSSELQEIVNSVKPREPARDPVTSITTGFELSERAKEALYL
ncbi:hypothetical protein TWF506_002861 [Arthrobotrys conoides]|uniref:CBM20 domain-containing protein n=1 Tax=Arthrobotrys conoides TaxID=74498 RepID=A0AAN8NM87_9PEZI